MDWIGVRHGADHRGAVHDLGQVGEQFTNIQSGQARSDRLQFAADLHRRVRLHVNGFKLARRAVEMKQDAGLGPAEVFLSRSP